jgi:hypothetical protein
MAETILGKIIMHMQNVMQLYENKLISHIDYNSWIAYTVSFMKTPGGAQWWSIARKAITPTAVAVIDDFLARNPTAPSSFELFPHYRPDE